MAALPSVRYARRWWRLMVLCCVANALAIGLNVTLSVMYGGEWWRLVLTFANGLAFVTCARLASEWRHRYRLALIVELRRGAPWN